MTIWKKHLSIFLCILLVICLIPSILSVKGDDTEDPDNPDEPESTSSSTLETEPTETTTTTASTTEKPTFSKSSSTITTTTTSKTTTTTTKTRETLPTVSDGGGGGPIITAAPSPTNSTIYGAGTTSIEDGNKVVANLSYDSSIPALFGLDNNELMSKSRFLFSSSLYSKLSDGKYSLMVFVGTSSATISNDNIKNSSKKGNALYNIEPASVNRAIFDTGLLVVSESENGDKRYYPAVNSAIDETIKASIPVPLSMRDNGYSVVAAKIGENGDLTLVPTSVVNQVATFDMQSFGDYVLLGIPGSSSSRGSGSTIPTIAIVLFIVAGIMLIGAGFLIYFYYIRKPKNGNGSDDPTDPNDPTPPPSDYDDSDVTEYIPTVSNAQRYATEDIPLSSINDQPILKDDDSVRQTSAQPVQTQSGSSLTEDERAKYERIIAQLQKQAKEAKPAEEVKDVSLGDIAYDDNRNKFDL